MTESTALLTSAQAAARLGVKPATLYAYVSRGLLVRHVAPDGRRSLFDPADLTRLESRGGARHASPTDVIVGSELALVDPAANSLWYRGVDALEAAVTQPFEAVCSLLWTGTAGSWRSGNPPKLSLPRRASDVDRLTMCASALAASQSSVEPSALMAALVDVLPRSSDDRRFGSRVFGALTTRPMNAHWLRAIDACLSLLCAPRLTHASLAARMAAVDGASLASCVASAMHAAVSPIDAYTSIEHALAVAKDDGVFRAADGLDPSAWTAAFSREPYRTGDPRTPVLLGLVEAVAPDDVTVARALADELRRRGADHPTASYAAAVLSWSSGMRPGSGAVIARIANAAGWIAHALEEYRLPTPYRPRIAYTGPAPSRASAPKRPIDAVLGYLARE